MEWNDMAGIQEPWYIQLGIVLSLLIALSTVFKLVIWPFFRRIWQALIAAPKIAESVGRLVELLEVDILHEMEVYRIKQDLSDNQVAQNVAALSGLSARLDAHDKRADAYEIRIRILEEQVERPD